MDRKLGLTLHLAPFNSAALLNMCPKEVLPVLGTSVYTNKVQFVGTCAWPK